LAAKSFIASGKDGYTAFSDPSIVRQPSDEVTLQFIVKTWLKNFSKTDKELSELPPKI
jgi:hypothetical protein